MNRTIPRDNEPYHEKFQRFITCRVRAENDSSNMKIFSFYGLKNFFTALKMRQNNEMRCTNFQRYRLIAPEVIGRKSNIATHGAKLWIYSAFLHIWVSIWPQIEL